ncbi:MAG: bifunctional riboflavin kinase/FAD synthetase [Cyanobacteria bacterium QS_4_48_99]|nr:MAG: bifunctional riboflavin kinase/FAD synthetase [Cyanobacteria bacterium QS_4_48_99]
MWITSSTAKARTPTVIALGNFDGVHRGHQQVMQPILPTAETFQRLRAAASQVEDFYPPNLEKTELPHASVVTFNPHPQEFFTGQTRKLLTPLEEKVPLLKELGIEQLVLLTFDRELASLSPWQFVEEILVQQLRATYISVGEDFRFGRERAGTSADLSAIAAHFGVEVSIASLQTDQDERISSSQIRQALEQGEISQANRLLGRSYTLTGTVEVGEKRGRTMGFPTANLQLPPAKLLPRQGVYYVRVSSPTQLPPTSPQDGVMNIGYRPTVDGTIPTVEVHLLDWSGDLYGQTLTVSLETFLRSEQKFSSLDALKAQITADCEAAKRYAQQKSHD